MCNDARALLDGGKADSPALALQLLLPAEPEPERGEALSLVSTFSPSAPLPSEAGSLAGPGLPPAGASWHSPWSRDSRPPAGAASGHPSHPAEPGARDAGKAGHRGPRAVVADGPGPLTSSVTSTVLFPEPQFCRL